MQLEIKSYTGGMVETNAYLIKNGDQSLLIDAPMGVTQWLEASGEMPTDLLLTHQHYDHVEDPPHLQHDRNVEDVADLISKGVRVHSYSPYSQELTLEVLKKSIGLPLEVAPYSVDDLLDDKTEIIVAGLRFKIEHVPGHSPDSIVFIIGDYAFVGDTLFSGSIGRADLPGGDMPLLVSGIQSKILTLSNNTRVFPGHGPETSVLQEKQHNPYLK